MSRIGSRWWVIGCRRRSYGTRRNLSCERGQLNWSIHATIIVDEISAQLERQKTRIAGSCMFNEYQAKSLHIVVYKYIVKHKIYNSTQMIQNVRRAFITFRESLYFMIASNVAIMIRQLNDRASYTIYIVRIKNHINQWAKAVLLVVKNQIVQFILIDTTSAHIWRLIQSAASFADCAFKIHTKCVLTSTKYLYTQQLYTRTINTTLM